VWYSFTKTKVTQHLDNSEFQMILDRAKARIGLSLPIQVYLSDERKTLLTHARQPFICGLQVTDKTVKKIISCPVEGEIVIAHELALVKRDYLWLTFLRNLGAIMYSMVTEGMILFSIIEPLLPFLYSFPPWILGTFITYPWGIGLIVWYRRKSAAEYEIESVYGSNPHLALYEVFSTGNMSDAGRRYYINEIESNIDIRKSRTLIVSLGLSILSSLIVLFSTFVIFSMFSAPVPFIEFSVLLLGGITFTFGVFHFESKGTGMLKQPKFSQTMLQSSDDELSTEIRKLLCTKLESDECSVIYLTPEMMTEYGEEVSMLEVTIRNSYLWVDGDEIEELKDPELISSFIFGSYIYKKSAISSFYFFYLVLFFAIIFFGGFFYWLSLPTRFPFYLIIWVIFSITVGGVFGMILGATSQRKQIIAMVNMLDKNPNYLIAARQLMESKNVQKWRKRDLEKKLRRMTRHTPQYASH
jgi:hypothetical protein